MQLFVIYDCRSSRIVVLVHTRDSKLQNVATLNALPLTPLPFSKNLNAVVLIIQPDKRELVSCLHNGIVGSSTVP